ncbi:hypothetical protein J4457_06510 [Candidatus Woesearchaeota archaeon]|nr:hypothetical protein [Candidatus Woesearchaeota archaeon]
MNKGKSSLILVLLVITFLFTISCVYAQDMNKADPRVSNYPGSVDLLNSDKLDTAMLDANDDGVTDTIAMDFDDDGLIDAYFVDANQDGTADLMFFDYNNDGTPDVLGVDIDGDEYPDAWDTNMDEELDAFDLNRDGMADAWDTNYDGKVDDVDEDGNFVPDKQEAIAPYRGGIESEEGGTPWEWLIIIPLIVVIIVVVVLVSKKKGAGEEKREIKKAERKIVGKAKRELKEGGKRNFLALTETDVSTGFKVGALLINLIFPGVGHFLLGTNAKTKAIIFTILTAISYWLVSVTLFTLLLFALWVYCIVDIIHAFVKK